MMIRKFQIDAFTDTHFKGNPAAVCSLATWLDDATLQAIAAEHNLSETAFYVFGEEAYELRWFTPGTEVDLCGHATLATAWVLRNEFNIPESKLVFDTRSGRLRVTEKDGLFTLDFPSQTLQAIDKSASVIPALEQAFKTPIVNVWQGDDVFIELANQSAVEALSPELHALKGLSPRGFIVTAAGNDVDFVSRWFGPDVGVNEDPVTGSAHTALTPFWAQRLGKTALTAKQLSARGGELWCEHAGERVLISGHAVKYSEGFITLND